LPDEEIVDYNVDEQELISDYVDPILSPILHQPERDKFFFCGKQPDISLLDCSIKDTNSTIKTYKKCPDASCAVIHERRLENYSSGFVEIKAEYKKKDSLSTHEDLLRLSLFGTHVIEENDAKCI
jgi:hypothetical protein